MTHENNNFNLHQKGKNPFAVPENYFENFEDKMMEQIKQQEGDFKVPVINMVKPYLYIAASFLLLFFIGKTVVSEYSTSDDLNLSSTELTTDEEMEIMYTEVDDFTITNYLLENDLENSENP